MMLSAYRDPFRTFDEIEREVIDPFVSQAIVSDLMPHKRRHLPRLICLDVFEAENEFKVIVEAAGVPKDKIDLSVDNGILTIRVVKTNPECPTGCNMLRNEIFYGTDTRTVRIPRGYHPEPSCCQFKDGVLCITFPKSEESESKKLQIESS
eukprot:scaffold14717_cov168-Ochromonas_danica.AAC.6